MLNVHLIRSAELDEDIFEEVVCLLKAVPGDIKFQIDPSSFSVLSDDELYVRKQHKKDFLKQFNFSLEKNFNDQELKFPREIKVATWAQFFNICQRYRVEKAIPDNEFVLLLTDVPNENNWFASLDVNNPFNGFVHTAEWEYFIRSRPAFPIAYEVIAIILQKYIFIDHKLPRVDTHRTPIGCVNDFCQHKSEIILKLRTADICKECMDLLRKKMSDKMILHALKLMESLRVKMLFSQNFRQSLEISRLEVDRHYSIFLKEFENIEIRLRPLEKVLYLFFLKHPEGIFMRNLSDHKEEIFSYYQRISKSDDTEIMRKRINELVSPLSNSASEKISRIKRFFEEAIGEDLASHYYIAGGNGDVKGILLDRSKVFGEGYASIR